MAEKPTAREMELDDALADVLTGFRIWKDRKASGCALTDEDEMFIRWVEAGPAREAA